MLNKQSTGVLLNVLSVFYPVLGYSEQALLDQYVCNNLPPWNEMTSSVSVTYKGIPSPFFCAFLCLHKTSCVSYQYYKESSLCGTNDQVFTTTLPANQPFCQKSYSIPSTVAPMVSTQGLGFPAYLTAFITAGVTCPSTGNCTCNQGLNAVDTPVSTPGLCYTECTKTVNCLAFSFCNGYCRVATTNPELNLIHSPGSFVCYY